MQPLKNILFKKIPMDFNQLLQKTGEFGIVEQVHLPIVIASGLPDGRLNEIVIFENGAMGSVFLLEKDVVQILVYTKHTIKPGLKITRTDTFLSVPVGAELLGHTITPLGDGLSNAEFAKPTKRHEIEATPPGMSERVKIATPFLTGVSVIDLMVPLGKGQKELVMGDRKAGKTSFLMSTMKNQIQQGTIVIYGAIAKRKSDIKKIEQFLSAEKLTDKTVIVATSPHDSPNLIYLTPYAAMTVGEYFRDQGSDVLVVLDDLSTHAYFYREMALVANKFPGRDAYPGDIFHAHARLLERAGNFKTEKGERSITVLPVAEVIEGDLTGYITTNLMSMTDGHIFFDGNVYFEGRRPAVNVGLSVTRVGRQAQVSLLRSINRETSAFLTLYQKLQNLSHFGAELTPTVQEVLTTGENIYTFFNQSFTVLLPAPVMVNMFGLIWLNHLKNEMPRLDQVKNNFVEAYNGQSKTLFDESMKCESLNQLLGYLNAHKDEFLLIAQNHAEQKTN